MLRNVLIISTSPNKGGSSAKIAKEFARGVTDAGNNVEVVTLRDKEINFCKGCLACQKTQKCVIRDDANEIVEKMKFSDVIVWVTPVYYYNMSGQMKTMIDRSNPLYTSDYLFNDIYLIVTAADSNINAADGTINGLMGWISCYEKAELKGVVKGLGIERPSDIEGHKALIEAYEMGKNV